MAVSIKTNAAQARAFGRNFTASESLEQLRVRRALMDRLQNKAANYDRAAARLELRGEMDAAKVLVKASRQLRGIMANAPPAED